MANETAEMIKNVAEEIKEIPVDEMIPNATPEEYSLVTSPRTMLLTAMCSVAGVAGYELIKWGAKKIWRFGGKVFGELKDKRNAKKAAKAKIVEGTDCVVEEAE